MKLNEVLRLLAGIMILVGVYLTLKVDKNFIWFLVFIAINLIQSAFTKWCPAIWLFRKMGFKD